MATPLEGLKVIELARILAGPWAGQTLSDLGAEVIKVEAPQGDDTRQWGPPFVERQNDKSASYFHSCNRGKSSVVIDFRADEGQTKLPWQLYYTLQAAIGLNRDRRNRWSAHGDCDADAARKRSSWEWR